MFGEYPDTMKKSAGSRLPSFTKTESNLAKGSIDFLGINFYFTCYVKNNLNRSRIDDGHIPSDLGIEFIGNVIVSYFLAIPNMTA